MEIIETQLDDVFLIKPDIFEDFRGDYIMLYNDNLYTREICNKAGISIKFIEHDISTSTKGLFDMRFMSLKIFLLYILKPEFISFIFVLNRN